MGAYTGATSLVAVSAMMMIFAAAPVSGYKNYTVGDSLGWYDALENPKVDYHKWASSHNFSLGDFLRFGSPLRRNHRRGCCAPFRAQHPLLWFLHVFNTDNNHSVIQTYNYTTYKLCDYSDALDNDTMQWSAADPSSTAPHSVSVAVPLLKVGETYFFSSDYDGEQCLNGQHFQINVTYGQGLPPSLRSDEDSPSPVSPQSGDEDSAPETLVPSNFDNPHDVDDNDDVESSDSLQLSAFSNLFGVQLYGLLVVVGLFILSN